MIANRVDITKCDWSSIFKSAVYGNNKTVILIETFSLNMVKKLYVVML
jgi:hypothetical protein